MSRPSFPLVPAKLRHPVPRPGFSRRRRLIGVLDAEPRRPIVSVVAPPGYGKTSLLAEWVLHGTCRTAWLILDDLDNEPSVFLTYLAAAIAGIAPVGDDVDWAVRSSPSRILGAGVPRLAAMLHRVDGPAVLVLDDAHRLVSRECLDALAALLDHLPCTSGSCSPLERHQRSRSAAIGLARSCSRSAWTISGSMRRRSRISLRAQDND